MAQSIATDRKSFMMQIIPVMLCFFSMGFVDLVGSATNFVKADLNLSGPRQDLFHHLSSSGFLSSPCLPGC